MADAVGAVLKRIAILLCGRAGARARGELVLAGSMLGDHLEGTLGHGRAGDPWGSVVIVHGPELAPFSVLVPGTTAANKAVSAEPCAGLVAFFCLVAFPEADDARLPLWLVLDIKGHRAL